VNIVAGGAGQRAVFLDRDGVLVEDRGPLTRPEDIVLQAEAGPALRQLKQAGYQLIVVSNQTAVSRGLLDEPAVRALEEEIERRLEQAGGVPLDGFYFCPHHPRATLPAYRRDCPCRKPAPGLLLRAAVEHGIDLARSTMVGDRPTDVAAGRRAGCRTIQVQTGQHTAAPIEVAGCGFVTQPADATCASLQDAARCILQEGWS
jgi:D-glycero-D-manno-heptose 1,7-bisphosphate phosphatase